MDALKIETIQDTDKEIMEITNNLGQHTTMNCRMNKVCNHINRRSLFS